MKIRKGGSVCDCEFDADPDDPTENGTWHRDNTRLVFVKMQGVWLRKATRWCDMRGVSI